jgi:hypothetical protein
MIKPSLEDQVITLPKKRYSRKRETRENYLRTKFDYRTAKKLAAYSQKNPECPDFHEYITKDFLSRRKKRMLLKHLEEEAPIENYSKDPKNKQS